MFSRVSIGVLRRFPRRSVGVSEASSFSGVSEF